MRVCLFSSCMLIYFRSVMSFPLSPSIIPFVFSGNPTFTTSCTRLKLRLLMKTLHINPVAAVQANRVTFVSGLPQKPSSLPSSPPRPGSGSANVSCRFFTCEQRGDSRPSFNLQTFCKFSLWTPYHSEAQPRRGRLILLSKVVG
jgi:hypothetical protein